VSAAGLAELRELKRGNRLLEQGNEVLRRAAAYVSQVFRTWLQAVFSSVGRFERSPILPTGRATDDALLR
jgi:hypothetical protein